MFHLGGVRRDEVGEVCVCVCVPLKTEKGRAQFLEMFQPACTLSGPKFSNQIQKRIKGNPPDQDWVLQWPASHMFPGGYIYMKAVSWLEYLGSGSGFLDGFTYDLASLRGDL